MKIKTNFSQNFSPKLRLKSSIKFIIIHYTGMQSEIETLNAVRTDNDAALAKAAVDAANMRR